MIRFHRKFEKKSLQWSQVDCRVVWPGLVLLFFTFSIFIEPECAQADSITSKPFVGDPKGTLPREIRRIRRDVDDLMRDRYRNENSAADSDKVTATPSEQSKRVETAGNPRLLRKIHEMEAHIRELTGHIEQFRNEIRLLRVRLNALNDDVGVRLQMLESGSLIPRKGKPEPTKIERETPLNSSDEASSVQVKRAPGQISFGKIPELKLPASRQGHLVRPTPENQRMSGLNKPVAKENRPASHAAPQPPGVLSNVVKSPYLGGLPEGTAKEQYEYAIGKLKARKYKEAENAFRAFIDRHPGDPLAGNAMYWMGETYYVQERYSEAAVIFFDAYKRFPKGAKAPANLLKLAKTLSRIGKDKDACITYVELVGQFPEANQRILSKARLGMKGLSCE